MNQLTVLLAALMLCASAFAEYKTKKWDGYNNPFKMDKNFEDRIQNLPLEGDISKSGFGWPAYFWANKKGGIAQRWNSKNPEHFKYESPSLYSLKTMSQDKINELSPAEKFDILNGRYNYPTVEKVWDQTSKRASDWHGICHGASPAGLNHKEPKAKTLTNADGIKITFHSSDIKALVAYYYAKLSDLRSTQIGRRCNSGRISPFRARKACKDVHPASLHIIVANKLGLTKSGFIADIDSLKQVWNHVAVKYTSKIVSKSFPSEKSLSGTHRVYKVVTKVSYTGGVDPSVSAILGTENEKWDVRKYEYVLDVNANGKILGGAWISKERPDFLWRKGKETFDHSYYGSIKNLL